MWWPFRKFNEKKRKEKKIKEEKEVSSTKTSTSTEATTDAPIALKNNKAIAQGKGIDSFLKAAQKMNSLAPAYPIVCNEIQYLLNGRKYKEAFSTCDIALKYYDHFLLYNTKGRITFMLSYDQGDIRAGRESALFFQQKMKEAIVYFKKAIELEPRKHAYLYRDLGKPYFELANREEAIRYFKKALELSKDDKFKAQIYAEMGALMNLRKFPLTRKGEFREVVLDPNSFKHFKKAIELDPDIQEFLTFQDPPYYDPKSYDYMTQPLNR